LLPKDNAAANKISKRPKAHPAGKRTMNKQPHLTGYCYLQVVMTSDMVCIDYREEASYVSRKLKNQASPSY
jgi:ERCC4-type nuclease